MDFDELDFSRFCCALQIDSKEQGLIALGDCLLGSQQYVIDRMIESLKAGVHEFVTLKCRQIGISTISLALDMYYTGRYPALPGIIVTHDEAARAQFRTTLALYRAGLPEEYQRDVIDDNRDQLVFSNGSRLRFLVAGTRSRATGSAKLGRSGAAVLAHATEVAYWGDPTGIAALRSSFAQTNPLRLFHWESTANGENWFKDMWDEAEAARSVRRIFVSWWANDGFYALPHESPLYQHYWGARGRASRDEDLIGKDVLKRYGVEINDCQWAWYRYMAAERITDEAQLAQEFPHREEDAFISTGASFFLPKTLQEAGRYAKSIRARARFYRVECGSTFTALKVDRAAEPRANLTVWSEPEPRGHYVIGVDPAYASNPRSNLSVVSVWRVWYNRIEQVAEFADRSITTHGVAWVMVYLAGHYGQTTLNLELNGPGTAVLQEFQNMRRQAGSGWEGDQKAVMRQVLGSIRQYLYRRLDSTTGRSTFIHTKTTADIKDRMMNGFRDYWERGSLIVGSPHLIAECPYVRRTDGSPPEADEHHTDDRVVAGALACLAWNDQMRTTLLANSVIYNANPLTLEEEQQNVVQRSVDKYLVRIGVVPDGSPPPPPRRALLGQKRWSGKLRDRLNRLENGRS